MYQDDLLEKKISAYANHPFYQPASPVHKRRFDLFVFITKSVATIHCLIRITIGLWCGSEKTMLLGIIDGCVVLEHVRRH